MNLFMEDNIKGGKKGSYDIVDEALKVVDDFVDRYFSFTTKSRSKKHSVMDKYERRLFIAAATFSILLGLIAAALIFWN